MSISKNVPHTYSQHNVRFFAFTCPCEVINKEEETCERAYIFYIFDEHGYVWFQATHAKHAFVDEGFRDIFSTRPGITIETPIAWNDRPLVPTDEWIQGSPDRGYALEVVKGALGLNLTYLTQLINDEKESV